MAILLSNFIRFTKFFTGRIPGEFAVHRLLKISPLLAYVTTLPCETSQSKNKRLTSVATYIRCGGLLITRLRKGYWCLSVKKN